MKGSDVLPPTLRERIPRPARSAIRSVRRLLRNPRARRELPARVVDRVALGLRLRRPPTMPAFPPVAIPDGPVLRPDLRVAVILDRFSTLALRYEWDQVPVTPEGWRDEVADHPPALLFVESAWNGNDDAWRLTVPGPEGPTEELRALVDWCREHGIPSVFWNKEDPPNYDRFIAVARLFDQVLTVDANCLPAYRRDLGHNRVSLLPFAAQPRIHNPVRAGMVAAHDVAFAGSYFTDRHPERREQMDYLLGAALDFDLHIYARKPGSGPQYRFPPQFERRIVGTVPYEQMLAAAHAYKVFLNVNSVIDSPTMCARRLFELSAAQAAVLSGPAAAVDPFFGADIPVAHDRASADRLLRVLLDDAEDRDRQALRAHRRVFARHLYRHRVNDVLATVGLPTYQLDQSITGVVAVLSPAGISRVLGQLGSQKHEDFELVLVTRGFELDHTEVERALDGADLAADRVVLRRANPNASHVHCLGLGIEAASGRYVATMSDSDLYAPFFLADLVHAFEYTSAQIIGKRAHYASLPADSATVLRFPQEEHAYTDQVLDGTLMTAREIAQRSFSQGTDTVRGFQGAVHKQGGAIYASDRFNYVAVHRENNMSTPPLRSGDLLGDVSV